MRWYAYQNEHTMGRMLQVASSMNSRLTVHLRIHIMKMI